MVTLNIHIIGLISQLCDGDAERGARGRGMLLLLLLLAAAAACVVCPCVRFVACFDFLLASWMRPRRSTSSVFDRPQLRPHPDPATRCAAPQQDGGPQSHASRWHAALQPAHCLPCTLAADLIR
jgi:hypothetical protein